MLSDPIADLLSGIKNAYLVDKEGIEVPYSKIKENLTKILVKKGYIKSSKSNPPAGGQSSNKKTLILTLKYKDKKPVLTNIKRISKPGVRIYVKKEKIPRVLSGLGTVILSTPKGLMTGKEARKKGLGGEVICEIW